MKRIKLYLVGSILILFFDVILLGIAITNNIQDKEINSNVLPHLSTSNSLEFEWYHTWGGNSSEGSRETLVDLSGNVFLGGYTLSFGEGYADMCLVKYDSSGVQQWNRTWGGTDFDYGNGIAIDSSGDIYLAGRTSSFGEGMSDMCLVKYDNSGTQQWNRTWGGTGGDFCNGVAVDFSSNIYLTGHTQSFGVTGSDIVLVKYNSLGIQQWNRTFDGGASDYGWGIATDSLGNLYIAGQRSGVGVGGEYNDMVLVKYDGNGILQWSRIWGGEHYDMSEDVVVDLSNNVYLAGVTESFGVGISAMALVKYDSDGIQQWNRTWDTADPDSGYGVAVDLSGNIYLSGSSGNFGVEGGEMALVKYDNSGAQQWNWTWGGDKNDAGRGVAVDSSSNVYLAGVTESFGEGYDDMVLVKFRSYTAPVSIPSYNFFIIIGMLGISSLLLVKKRLQQRPN
ncbi:MAG: SBBP repeat-containing protein [Promethearchaeota archaeon]